MMDKRKIEILKLIDKAKNSNYCLDYNNLNDDGYETGLLRVMIKEELIGWGGSFYLKDKGEMILKDSLLLEALNKKNTPKIKIIFDSNVYDDIVSGNLNVNTIKKEKYEFYITHIQVDEINNCLDNEKRAQLFLFKTKIAPILLPTESMVWNASRWGNAKWGDGQILEKLKKGNHKHINDALIGETAIKNNILLVTNDNTLRKRVHSNGGRAMSLDEFKNMLGTE